jgi:CheY-like chemotaxis protein
MLTKRLAELQGGTVSVESEEGKGSIFTVAMPYRKEPVTGLEPAVKQKPPLFAEIPSDNGLTCGKVLIVEDDPDAAELISTILEREGCETITAGTVQEGLDLAEKEKPDMITLDILMPVVIGWNFLEKVKEDEELKHIPVVVISIVADEKKGFSLGAADVLQKPFRKDRLLEAVRNAGVVCRTDSQPKVLVVDDDPKAVEIVARNLEEKKFSVIRAYGGQEGIDAAIKELPDLIILDLMMPEVNGFDVVYALKEKPETAAIPIIILTAKVVTEEDEDELKGHVVNITKKVDFSEEKFLAEVRRTFQKKKAVPSGAEDRERTETRRIKKPLKKVTPGKWKKPPLALVVEDNPKDSEIFKRYLVEAGFKVAQAFDGGTALDMMKTAKPDVITLDIIMSGMGGFRFLEEKAKNPEFADIPVVIVTSVSEKGKGLQLGADAFVRKPVPRNELLSIISSLGLGEQKHGKAKVLVIDDDPKAVKIISSYFGLDMFSVSKAYGGEEGLEIARNEIPDLIVLDLMMPGMNGFEVLDQLKRNENTMNIHVIIMTAKLLTKREREQLASQVEMVAEKGKFDREEFIEQVKRLISKRTA